MVHATCFPTACTHRSLDLHPGGVGGDGRLQLHQQLPELGVAARRQPCLRVRGQQLSFDEMVCVQQGLQTAVTSCTGPGDGMRCLAPEVQQSR